MIQYSIKTIKNYPDNGNHLELITSLPFCIRKGEDGYYYRDKNNIERKYNLGDKLDKRWIVHLTKKANESLVKIFEIKTNKNLGTLLVYCEKIYRKSLKMEIKRLSEIINKDVLQHIH